MFLFVFDELAGEVRAYFKEARQVEEVSDVRVNDVAGFTVSEGSIRDHKASV